MFRLIRYLGSSFLNFLIYLGELTRLTAEIFGGLFKGRPRFKQLGEQIVEIGWSSQAVAMVTGAFIGAVFAAQTYFQFKRVALEVAVGSVVSVAMCRELGPVLAALMVTGRAGAAMAAELGTMKVTEQVDALRALGVHPVEFLVIPRLIAMMIAMPILVAQAIFFGVWMAYVVTVHVFRVEGSFLLNHMLGFTSLQDIIFGLTKGFVFAIFIAIICCHQGLTARNGAVGVGRGTTRAVVYASLAILVSNFFLTIFLNVIFPTYTP